MATGVVSDTSMTPELTCGSPLPCLSGVMSWSLSPPWSFAWLAYARVAIRLTPRQRFTLTGLRALTLLLIVFFLLRPVVFVQATGARDGLVAVLVDVSRSMRLADEGSPRIEQARELATTLQKQISGDFRTELFSFGETLERTDAARLSANARRSDLSGALAALVDRYRGQRLAGVVVLSDGGDTSTTEAGTMESLGVPVFTVGVGRPIDRSRSRDSQFHCRAAACCRNRPWISA